MMKYRTTNPSYHVSANANYYELLLASQRAKQLDITVHTYKHRVESFTRMTTN